MSQKNKDNHNRWRNKTVAFRMSPEEAELLDRYVHLSGLTKQDYLISCILQREIVVNGNPRVYKALRNEMAAILRELQRMESCADVGDEFRLLVQMVATIMGGIQKEAEWRIWIAH